MTQPDMFIAYFELRSKTVYPINYIAMRHGKENTSSTLKYSEWLSLSKELKAHISSIP